MVTGKHTKKLTEVNPDELRVKFPDGLRQAFADLAAAVHFSDHFEKDFILPILQDWAAGKSPTAKGLAMGLPEIAEETWKHIHATGDVRAAKAWEDIKLEIGERSFSLEKIGRSGPERAGR